MEQTEKENNSWRKHCRNAVKKFVMNAVVIDNEPFTAELTSQQNLVAQTASLIDDGMSEAAPLEIAKCPSEENFTDESSPSDGKLDIREISDAFADEEIACAFVLPKDGDRDENAILDRIVNASRHTDIIVLDWYLQDKNSALAEKVLKKIASIDTTEKGRMRLICVYTSQPLNDEIIDIALKCLRDGGLSLNKVQNNLLAARNEHHYLLLLNKQDVEGNKLPDRLLDAMIDLADGLLPAFSLSAVAAVRKNMHHIISRFSASLDNAFVANLLITDPPEDVTELIRELFISECDSALGLENVVDNCLNNKKVKNWLEVKKDTRSTELCALIENGLIDGKLKISDTEDRNFKEEKRCNISKELHGDDTKMKKGEATFAQFVTLKREAFGKTKCAEDWLPSLTLGTLLHNKSSNDFFYCLTPACDTIRLRNQERFFVMLKIEEVPEGNGKTELLISIGKDDPPKKFMVNKRPHFVRSFCFEGNNENGRVMAIKKADSYIFTPKTNNNSANCELEWIGEVRRNHATRDMADLNREWLRLGVNDSEYLRLAGKGHAQF